MNKEETKFENYGYNPMRDFFVEVQNEANKFGINALPLGVSAVRFDKHWEIIIEYNRRIDITILDNFIKCNKYTIKFYNEDYNEEKFIELYYKNYYSKFSVYTEESLLALIEFLKHYDVSMVTYAKNNFIKDALPCRKKSKVKCAYKLDKYPCYIIDETNNKLYCEIGSYIIQNEDGTIFNVSNDEFCENYELY